MKKATTCVGRKYLDRNKSRESSHSWIHLSTYFRWIVLLAHKRRIFMEKTTMNLQDRPYRDATDLAQIKQLSRQRLGQSSDDRRAAPHEGRRDDQRHRRLRPQQQGGAGIVYVARLCRHRVFYGCAQDVMNVPPPTGRPFTLLDRFVTTNFVEFL